MEIEKGCHLGQGFGYNYNNSYSKIGLKGHPAIDYSCGYGSPIYFPYEKGFVYKVLTKENPSYDGSGFTGVFVIIDDSIECFEYLVGHCNPAVSIGQTLKKGDLIGYEANNGTVFSGNIQITLAMQKTGDERGSHRHVQKRPVMKTKITSGICLSTQADNPAGSHFRDQEGFYYKVFDYENGYNGCIDFKGVFNRDLQLFNSGYDVFVLQRILIKEELADFEATGFYGLKTKKAVENLQKKYGILPSSGYFGKKTQKFVKEKYLI